MKTILTYIAVALFVAGAASARYCYDVWFIKKTVERMQKAKP